MSLSTQSGATQTPSSTIVGDRDLLMSQQVTTTCKPTFRLLHSCMLSNYLRNNPFASSAMTGMILKYIIRRKRLVWLFVLWLSIIILLWNLSAGKIRSHQNLSTLVRYGTAARQGSGQGRTSGLLTGDSPGGIVWVEAGGGLMDRLVFYNKDIDQARSALLSTDILNRLWRDLDNTSEVTIAGVENNQHLQRLLTNDVTTVALRWADATGSSREWSSLADTHNLLVQKYYEWTASPPLSDWITSPRQKRDRDTSLFCNLTCNSNVSKSIVPQSLEPLYFHTNNSLPSSVNYMHIVPNGVITADGEVFFRSIKLVHRCCHYLLTPNHPFNYTQAPLYQEVYIISHRYGKSHFHKTVEDIPRLAPHMEFLKNHPQIYIHCAEEAGLTAYLLGVLGFSTSRILTGMVRANIIYNPQGSNCFEANVVTAQMMSHIYRRYVYEHFSKRDRNSLVMIRRSHFRKFTDITAKEELIKKLAENHGLTFEIFRDHPPPSFEDQMQIFNRAVMVVGPHGAGMANLLYTEPGAVVIEGVCHPPLTVLCFQWLAHILGHRYHAIPSTKGCEGVINIATDKLGSLVETYLNIYFRINKTTGN